MHGSNGDTGSLVEKEHGNGRQKARALLYDNWDTLLNRTVCQTMYRYQIFVTEEDLTYGSPIFKFAINTIGIGGTKCKVWWQLSGHKKYLRAVNSKRQTLCNTLKGKVVEKFAGGSEEPPSPGDIFSINKQTGEISGLRQNKEIYMKFLQHFAKTVYGKTFAQESKTTLLSSFLQPGLECFLVLAYINGYEVWKSEGMRRRPNTLLNTLLNDDNTATGSSMISDLSSEAQNHLPKYKFTANGRGSKTGEGWTEEGLALYNALRKAINVQRKDVTNGPTFDSDFLNYTMTNTSQRRKKNKAKIRIDGDWGFGFGVVDTDHSVSQSNDTSDPVAEDDTTDQY